MKITFPADPELAARIAQVAAAEEQCCAFFDFTLHLTPDEFELVLRVPDTAAALVAEALGVLT